MRRSLFSFSTVPALILFASSAVSPFVAHDAREFDFPPSLPFHTDYYAIDSLIKHSREPGFLKFRVISAHADYEVEGWTALTVLLREIEVIERLHRGMDETTGFWDGFSGSWVGLARGLYGLLRHPVASVKGVGVAGKKAGRRISSAVRGREPGERTMAEEKILGDSEREIANMLGVDVYTENPHLRELLFQMARARQSGKWAAFGSGFLVPMPGAVSIALSAGSVNHMADQIVNEHSRVDVYRLNLDRLLALGFPEDEAKAFLNSPYLTPREATRMRSYLEELRALEGSESLLQAACDISSIWEGRRLLYAAELAVENRSWISDPARLRTDAVGIAAIGREKIILFTPFDFLGEPPVDGLVLRAVADLAGEWPGRAVEIWNLGDVSEDFAARAREQGLRVREWTAKRI